MNNKNMKKMKKFMFAVTATIAVLTITFLVLNKCRYSICIGYPAFYYNNIERRWVPLLLMILISWFLLYINIVINIVSKIWQRINPIRSKIKQILKKHLGEIIFLTGLYVTSYNIFNFGNRNPFGNSCGYEDSTLFLIALGAVVIGLGVLIIRNNTSPSNK